MTSGGGKSCGMRVKHTQVRGCGNPLWDEGHAASWAVGVSDIYPFPSPQCTIRYTSQDQNRHFTLDIALEYNILLISVLFSGHMLCMVGKL